MTIADDFKDAERRALVENTAQDVFNNLKDLVNYAPMHASRWIWELLQNARDATIPDSHLHVSVCLTEKEVTFQHNGMSFSMDQVAHLIHHGSTKGEGDVGRFGTGFLSTHIISKKPQVSGRLIGGKTFSFTLDRTGATPRDLTDSMNRSANEFVESIGNISIDQENHSTRYVYPLTDNVQGIAQQGVGSLESYAPYVLAFNHEIGSIEIERDGERHLYIRQPSRPLAGEQVKATSESVLITQIDVKSSSKADVPPFLVAAETADAVMVALLAQRIGEMHKILFGPEVPSFFMAFPIFDPDQIRFPGVMNSRKFCPQKDRDGLYLGSAPTDDNAANKKLIEQACPLFVNLLEQCARAKWKGIDLLCNLTATVPKDVDEQWLSSLVKDSLVEPIRAKPLLVTCSENLIAASDAWIPIGLPNASNDSLWALLYDFADSDSKLVNKVTADSWAANIQAWASVLGVPPEGVLGSFTLKGCAEKLADFGSLDRLREALRSAGDPLAWCNKLFGLLIQSGQTSLFDSLPLLPDQNGAFKKRATLGLDRQIGEELKDIGEDLGLPIRAGLLHSIVANTELKGLFQPKAQDDVLTDIIGHLESEAKKPKPIAGFRQGNVRLFAWILKNGSFEHLESFPVLTQEQDREGQAQHLVLQAYDGESEDVPLAPPNAGRRE